MKAVFCHDLGTSANGSWPKSLRGQSVLPAWKPNSDEDADEAKEPLTCSKTKNNEQHGSTWPFKLWHNEKHTLKSHVKSPDESVELAPPPPSRGWSSKWCLQEVRELKASNWKRWCQWQSLHLWSHNLSQEVVEEAEEATSRRACQIELNAIQNWIWKASARKVFPALATVMKSKERRETNHLQ